ncbi:MAG: nitronate monooxygenase, partial [Patescibacteria group bacterium]
LTPSRDLIELTICANFCQVWLAKEGHNYPIGINYLEKVQMPHLYALYGAMLAHVDYLFVGAGIPMQFSAVMDKLVRHLPATYSVYVIGAEKSSDYRMHFDPRDFIREILPELPRPKFFPIISSPILLQVLTKSGDQKIAGCVVETKEAGGHSAGPRGKMVLTDAGEPLYGARDEIDFEQLRRIGLPFYLAGAYASPEMLAHAKTLGAVGIQVASIFALSDQPDHSGIDPKLRSFIRREAYNGRLVVFNDPNASPTGFPFKVVRLPGTLGDPEVFALRHRVCDIGGLVHPYIQEDGSVGYRCSAEPVNSYLKKGGKIEDTANTMCLCNGLHATPGLGQRLKNGTTEPSVVTLGQDLSFLQYLMSDENDSYTIGDAIQHLLKQTSET